MNGATASSQSQASSSASYSGQVNGNEFTSQSTHSSTVEQPENGVTSSQLGSTGQPETSASPPSTTLPVSLDTLQDALAIEQSTSGSIASETSVPNAGGQGQSSLDSQTQSSSAQQTDTQAQPGTTQGIDALHSTRSSQGAGTPSATTSIAGSSALVSAAGENTKSVSNSDVDRLAGAVTTASGGLESSPLSTAGADSSAVVLSAGTTIHSDTIGENDHLSVDVTTAAGGTPLATSAGVSAAVPEETIKASSEVIDGQSSAGGEATSGTPAPNTKTGSEGSAITNTNSNDVSPTTKGSAAGATTTPAAQPASSPLAPQSVTVSATGTTLGSDIGHATAVSGVTQSIVTPESLSSSLALESNLFHVVSQVVGSLTPTTLGEGAVVQTTAQVTGASKDTTSPVSVSSPGGDQNSGPVLSTGSAEAASVPNPSLAAAASKLNGIPASIENPLATASGNPPSIFNPALTAAASAVDVLPASVLNPEHQVSLVGSPESASQSIPGASSLPGGVSQNTAGATGSPTGGTTSPVAGTESQVGATASPIVSGSPVGGAASAVGGTESQGGATGSPVGGTETQGGATASPMVTGSPIGGTASAVGGTETQGGATGSPVGATGSQVGGTGSPSGEATPGPIPGGSALTSGDTHPNSQNTAPGSGLPESGPVTASNGEVVHGTATLPPQSATPVSGIAGLSTQSDGNVVTVSAAAATGSTVSNGQIVPITTGHEASAQSQASGIAGLSTQSDGKVVPVSAAAATGSTVSNGQIVPITTGHEASAQSQASGIAGLSTQSDGKVVPVSAAAATGSTVSNGQIVPVTTGHEASVQSQASGIVGLSTQSDGKVVPVSAAAATGSTVSNGQIVPIATGHEASAQSPAASETGVAAASNAAQSAAAVAAGATQSNIASSGPTETPFVPPQQFYGKGPYTQSPVGYDTSTTQPVPTSIVHGPSSTPSATQGQTFGPSSLPSNVPLILYQNGGPGAQPANTRTISVAFRYPLNYLFVYNNTVSQEQIFHYIPLGISYGLEIETSQIIMKNLQASDTYKDVGYVTTLALAWIPEGLVDNLALLVSTSVSRFYRNPDNSTAFLLSMINTAIPITSNNGTDGASGAYGNIPSDTNPAKTAGAPIGGDIGNSEHVRASAAGIGVGVACGAAAYGAAMFFVARRYKKRRQSHLRSPSMFSSPVMSHAGPDAGAGAALMSGAMGERSASPYYDNDGRAGSRGSGRSGSSRHQISAPVMAENSLGWN